MRYEPKLRNAALAAALAFGAVGAWADGGGPLTLAPTASFANTVSGSFTDSWTFTLATASYLSGSLTNVETVINDVGTGGITDFEASILPVSYSFERSSVTTEVSSPVTFKVVTQLLIGGLQLDAGSYILTVSGTGISSGSASYGGNLVATPIPEPGTYTMLLAGLGVVGFIAFRRRQDD